MDIIVGSKVQQTHCQWNKELNTLFAPFVDWLSFYNYEYLQGFGLGYMSFVALYFIGFTNNIQNFPTCPSIGYHVYLWNMVVLPTFT
jgi:hypothetical protein